MKLRWCGVNEAYYGRNDMRYIPVQLVDTV